jgi:hypothetical protein
MKKVIAIFANSIKHGKHCVAGKDVATNEWVRAVSDADGTELTDDQCKFANPYGEFCVKPLQKIEMEFSAHAPLLHQPENFVISNAQWQQEYTLKPDEITAFLDYPETLWGLGNNVSYSAIVTNQLQIEQSLYLIKVENVRLHTTTNVDSKLKRRISFIYNGNNYDLPVTDPQFDKLLNNELQHQEILCVSLGEEYQGYCYKIVATILCHSIPYKQKVKSGNRYYEDGGDDREYLGDGVWIHSEDCWW